MGRRIFGGPFNQRKGESIGRANERRHRAYKEWGIMQKKAEGKWLSKADYERKTGRRGWDD